MFLKNERTGNWVLHLQAVHDMLPCFAASGHIRLAKSAYLYSQMIKELLQTHTEVYRIFQEGYHGSRRRICFWAGLSIDLIIEQVLLRSIRQVEGGPEELE